MKKLMLIAWPSFLAAGVAEVVFFTVFDPSDFEVGRLAAYTVGFFLVWLLAAASSALNCLLQSGARAPTRSIGERHENR